MHQSGMMRLPPARARAVSLHWVLAAAFTQASKKVPPSPSCASAKSEVQRRFSAAVAAGTFVFGHLPCIPRSCVWHRSLVRMLLWHPEHVHPLA